MILTGGTFSCLIIFMAAGIFAGFVYNIIYLPARLTKNNVIVVFVSDFIGTLLCGAIFYVMSLKYFYGEINIYFIVCFMSGIVFELIFIKNLVANPIKVVYNKIRNSHKFNKGKGL